MVMEEPMTDDAMQAPILVLQETLWRDVARPPILAEYQSASQMIVTEATAEKEMQRTEGAEVFDLPDDMRVEGYPDHVKVVRFPITKNSVSHRMSFVDAIRSLAFAHVWARKSERTISDLSAWATMHAPLAPHMEAPNGAFVLAGITEGCKSPETATPEDYRGTCLYILGCATAMVMGRDDAATSEINYVEALRETAKEMNKKGDAGTKGGPPCAMKDADPNDVYLPYCPKGD